MPHSIQITKDSPLLHDANCVYCHVDLELGDQVLACDSCQSPHHVDCWQANNFRCATFGCSGSGAVPQVQTPSANSGAAVQGYLQTPSIRTVRTLTAEEALYNRHQRRTYRPRSTSSAYETTSRQFLSLSHTLKETGDRVNGASWSPQRGSTSIAVAYEAGVIKIGDMQKPGVMRSASYKAQRTLQSHLGAICSIVWSPFTRQSSPLANLLAIAFRNGTVSIWDLEDSREFQRLESSQTDLNDEFTSNASWSANGENIAFGNSWGRVHIWDVRSGERLESIQCHDGAINSLSWSSRGQRLLTGSSDKTVKVSNVDSGQMLVFSGHNSAVNCVTWSPNGQRFAFSCDDGTVRICDTREEREIVVLHTHSAPVMSVSWSPYGTFLASGSTDGTVQVVDVERQLIIPVAHRHEGQVNSVSWSMADGRLASGSSDSTVKIWTIEDRRR